MRTPSLTGTIAALALLLAACGGGSTTTAAPDRAASDASTAPNGAGAAPPAALPAPGMPPDDPAPGPIDPTVRWTIAEVPNPGGRIINFVAFNDAGDVLGSFAMGDRFQPVYGQTDGLILASPSGFRLIGNVCGTRTYPASFNNAGTIVANGREPVWTNGQMHYKETWFLYENGRITAELPDGSGLINNTGTIAGSRLLSTDLQTYPWIYQAFIYADGVVTDIPRLPGGTSNTAVALNDAGQVAGISEVDGAPRGFIYSGGSVRDLGVLPGTASVRPTAINHAGDIVGYAAADAVQLYETPQPFFYSNGQIHALPLLGRRAGVAASINDQGQVVGWLGSRDGCDCPIAFIYRNGQIADLNTLPGVADAGWVITSPRRINNAGQIFGSGTFQGRSAYFVLSPLP